MEAHRADAAAYVRPEGGPADAGRAGRSGAVCVHRTRRVRAAGAGARMTLRVLKAGLSTTVQDLGRYGYAHLGISPCGGAVFFKDTATTEIDTLSLHDALPI